MKKPVIAIDGPAGAGKSTVAELIAKQTNLRVLNTGAMYRALAFKAAYEGVDPDDEEALAKLARNTEIKFGAGDPAPVLINGEDPGPQLRTLEVGQLASRISTHSSVRRILVAAQQKIAEEGGFILEGRDVTTVVVPDADVKVFLTASIEERARRRWIEHKEKGDEKPLTAVVLDVVERDYRDYTRSDSPLRLGEDVTIIESHGVTAEEVARKIAGLLPQS